MEKSLFRELRYTIFYLFNETFIEIAPSYKKTGFGESILKLALEDSCVHAICSSGFGFYGCL